MRGAIFVAVLLLHGSLVQSALRRPSAKGAFTKTWASQLMALRKWMRNHEGKLPSQSGRTKLERKLAQWVKKQRAGHNNNALTPDRIASCNG